MKVIITNKITGATDCYNSSDVSISFSDGRNFLGDESGIVEVPNGLTMRNFVISQLSDINIGDIIIPNVVGQVSTFRMNISQYALSSGKKFRTRVNSNKDLVIKRLK